MYKVATPLVDFDYLNASGSYGYALGLEIAYINGNSIFKPR